MPIDTSILTNQPTVLDTALKLSQLRSMGQQQQLGQQQMQTAGLENQQRQNELNAQQALNEAMRTAVTTGPDGTPKFDRQAITTHLAASGAGHLIPQVMDSLQKIDQTAADIREKNAKADESLKNVQQAQTDYRGLLGLGVKDAGYDPKAAIASIAHALANKQIDQDTATQLTTQIQQNPTPETVQSIVDPMISQSLRAQQVLQERATARAANANADKTAQLLPGDVRNQQLTTKELEQKTTGTAPLTAKDQAELRIQRANAQTNAGRLDLEKKKYDLTYGQGVNENGQSIVGTLAQQVSDLQTPPPSPRSPLYGPVMMRIQQMRQQQGKQPYQETDWTNKSKAAKDFSPGGTLGQQALALNTLVRHSSDMIDLIPQLGNGSFTPANAAYQKLQQIAGSATPTNFDQLKQYVAGETVKLIRGGGGSEGDIQAAQANINKASSPQQLTGALQTNFAVAGGKMQALNQAARKAGLGDKYTVLDPDAAQIVQRRGYDPDTLKPISGGAGSKPALSVGQTVTLRNGKKITIKAVHPDGTFD